MVQKKETAGVDRGCSSGDGETLADRRYILKVELTPLGDEWDMKGEGKNHQDGSHVFG